MDEKSKIEELSKILCAEGIREDIINKFSENKITKDEFGEFTRDELKEIGIPDLKDYLILKKVIRKIADTNFEFNNQEIDTNSFGHSVIKSGNSEIFQNNEFNYSRNFENTALRNLFTENIPIADSEEILLSSVLYHSVIDLKLFLKGRLKELSDIYVNVGNFDWRQKNDLLNLLMTDFVNKHGYYNNLDYLDNLAKSIILSWPNLGQKRIENGIEYLDSSCLFARHVGPQSRAYGTLYFKMDYLRQKLSPTKKKKQHKNILYGGKKHHNDQNSPLKTPEKATQIRLESEIYQTPPLKDKKTRNNRQNDPQF